MEVKQSKIPQPEDIQAQNYSTREQQKSPRQSQQQQQPNTFTKLQALKDVRNEKKKQKQQTQNNQAYTQSKNQNEPRVIADEPMFDEEEEEPLQVREIKIRGQLTAD